MPPLTKFTISAILTSLVFSFQASAQDRIVYQAPMGAGHALREMKTAGFWISRHPSPDALIMGPEAIDRFNTSVRTDKKLTKDIFTLVQDLKTASLLDDLEKTLADIIDKDYYTAAGVKGDDNLMDQIKGNMNLSGVVMGVEPRYGLVVHYAYQRLLPTHQGLYAQRGDLDFDQLQNSALDVGTPVAVVHTSADGLWYYVMTSISDGWVEARDVALGNMDQVKEFAEGAKFALVIKPKADIFADGDMTAYVDYARMGTRLPLAAVDGRQATVDIPAMDTDGTLIVKQAYMNTEDVHAGFLPFTARNIYKQALIMLNEPYGWGDAQGEQDCSRFLQMVFATVGIVLPRDSKDQKEISHTAVDFDEKTEDALKIAAIIKSSPANTFLAMKGHIMLYLGDVEGRPYAIHDTSGYKQIQDGKEVTYAIDRVIISDLSLGEGSPKGSLLRRLSRTVTIE